MFCLVLVLKPRSYTGFFLSEKLDVGPGSDITLQQGKGVRVSPALPSLFLFVFCLVFYVQSRALSCLETKTNQCSVCSSRPKIHNVISTDSHSFTNVHVYAKSVLAGFSN